MIYGRALNTLDECPRVRNDIFSIEKLLLHIPNVLHLENFLTSQTLSYFVSREISTSPWR